jgi:hypothetical protein
VSDAARRWLASYIATTRTPKGQRVAAARIERYLAPFMGSKQFARVDGSDLRYYRLWLEGKGISLTMVWRVLSDARCLCRWAEDEGLVERSLFPRRVMPRL